MTDLDVAAQSDEDLAMGEFGIATRVAQPEERDASAVPLPPPTPPVAAPAPAPPVPVVEPPAATMSASALESARTKLANPAVLANVKNHAINAEVTRKRLPLAGGQMESVRALALGGTNEALPVETELVLRNIKFDAHPGSQFKVILERRDDPSDGRAS